MGQKIVYDACGSVLRAVKCQYCCDLSCFRTALARELLVRCVIWQMLPLAP